MKRLLYLLLPIALAAAQGRASPFWVEYEPASGHWPEEEGWTRLTYAGGAQRALEQGTLVIDSRQSLEIADFYQLALPDQLHLEAGEAFEFQWRLMTTDLSGPWDPGVGVFADDNWAVGFHFSQQAVFSVFEPQLSAQFTPGAYHDFVLRSDNMRAYELRVDGQLALQGSFWYSLDSSRVGWGDVTQGGASLARWGYVRLGIVPEPSGWLMLTCLLPLVIVLGRLGAPGKKEP